MPALLMGDIGLSDLFYKHFTRFAGDCSVLTFDYQIQFADNGEFANAVAELLRHLNKKVWLVGQSLGSVVAQVIAFPPPGGGGRAGSLQHLSADRQREQDPISGSDADGREPTEVQKMHFLLAIPAHQADDDVGGNEKRKPMASQPRKKPLQRNCAAP